MATEEHKVLSSFIKNLHEKLRENSKQVGPEIAWAEHCKETQLLERYASAMQELATKHWEKNLNDTTKEATSRITWVNEQCKDYFYGPVKEYQRTREEAIMNKIAQDSNKKCDINIKLSNFVNKLNILDVGSCYNPFQNDEMFEVTAIDLAPANKNVQKCDFLKVHVGGKLYFIGDTITELPMDYYDVVLFSLLLEYLPSSKQRVLCCEKAYKLLKPEGILIIITPDSKHAGANAKIMKSWRFTLACLGFMRIKYEKLPHLHCLTFRKCIFKDVSNRWVDMHKDEGFSLAINIPQDFKEPVSNSKDLNNCGTYCKDEKLEMFLELPGIE